MKQVNFNPPKYGTISWLVLKTLYAKEVLRFLAIPTQTILAPIVTSLLFLAVFQLSIGQIRTNIEGLTFIQFIVPGLIMMNIAQNSFWAASTPLVASKMTGSIVDFLLPPISSFELLLAFIGSGVTRGIIVALSAGVIMALFTDITIYSFFYTIVFCLSGALMLSFIGILTGIWAEKWEQISAISSYIITPLSFLSGTFYSLNRLPEALQTAAHFNPFFYMIDGFRYGMTGYSDSSPLLGLVILSSLNFILFIVSKIALKKGWKIKS